MAKSDKKQFEADPSRFLEDAITQFIATSPKNTMATFNNEPIFEAPLVGFADGDDPIFRYFQTLIGEPYLTPQEVLARHRQETGRRRKRGDKLSVIAYVLPIARETRLSLARESVLCSLRWNHTRWHGEAFLHELDRFVVSLIESLGYEAVGPEVDNLYLVTVPPGESPVANWSHRHAAYAAGLGTFSLNEGLITSRGMAMRCSSVVCNASIPPSPRTYADHLANCLFYQGVACVACIKRCPAGAISEQGHDKLKCRAYLNDKQKVLFQEMGRNLEGYIGRYIACGLCQVKVPCEAKIPARPAK